MDDVFVEFVTAAKLEEVWSYFVEPDLLSCWHGHAELFEAWPSGRVRFADEGWPAVEGQIEIVEPYRRIEWVVPADNSRIVETFTPGGTGTHVQVRQAGLSPDWPVDGLPGRIRGWQESIADLVLLVDHGIHAARHLAARASLGMHAVEVAAGLQVESIEAGGPADRAGLRSGDVMLSVDRVPVYQRPDLSIVLRGLRPGETIDVSIVRARDVLTTPVTLA